MFHTRSTPNLGPSSVREPLTYRLKTQQVPEDSDSSPWLFRSTHTTDRETGAFGYPLLSTAMHYGSFASLPSPNVEIELSGANPTHRALCPITFEPTLENVYMYHRPQAMTYSEEERHIRDTEAETWRNLYRDDPEAACHTHSFTSSQTAVIRVGDHGYFEVHNGPLHTLEPGMHIVCFGDMVGDWFSTSRMKRHKHTGYTSWEWVNHKAEICTIVQVPNQYSVVLPSGLIGGLLRWVNKILSRLKPVSETRASPIRGKIIPEASVSFLGDSKIWTGYFATSAS
ncbi:hypothetical protein C8R47DRAFT_1229192 [Mycena vitilis]|nr:hypothetical protein C8R47DRAFT_1231324 [Mycena vitilis]KAJ6453042.1 hypothetical protein C8R47DRAFT_1229192 [Mycena vitilis]